MASGFEDLVSRLRDVASDFPEWQAPTFGEPATERDLTSLRAATGIGLPSDFTTFLKITDAVIAMDIHNGYWIGGSAELSRSLRRGDYPVTVDADGRATRVVPVATDGGGNAFFTCVDTGTIWRWDHETGRVNLVAQDLADFLRRVADDWLHARSDDPSWNYLV